MRQLMILCAIVALGTPVAWSQSANTGTSTIHVMVKAVGHVPVGANNPFTPAAVASDARHILEGLGYQVDAIPFGSAPANATTLRLMYIVNEKGNLVAVAASSQLLASVGHDGGYATLSLYSGIQQNVARQDALAASRKDAERTFSRQLATRLGRAMQVYQQYRRR